MQNNVEKPKRMFPWGRILLYGIFIFFALFFLLKGEDSPYDFSTNAGVFRERGISAYTYYFVWPESKRVSVDKIENAFLPMYMMLKGYPDMSKQDIDNIRHHDPGHQYYDQNQTLIDPWTLKDQMEHNVNITLVFFGITVLIFIVDFFVNYLGKKSQRIRSFLNLFVTSEQA